MDEVVEDQPAVAESSEAAAATDPAPSDEPASEPRSSSGSTAENRTAPRASQVEGTERPRPAARKASADRETEEKIEAGPQTDAQTSPPASDDDEKEGSPRKRRRRRRRKSAPAKPKASEVSPGPAEVVHLAEHTATAAQPAEKTSTDLEALAKGLVYAMPERHGNADERKIAIFCDLENVALGVRDSDIKQFDVTLILERLLEKGKIIAKKAYADWERFHEYKRAFHEAAIELIDIPQKYYSGKNSADIKMVVDAMDLCYSKEHLDTFVVVSGDSDFSPLVSKLKENDKYVIGVGVKNSSSNLLISNCDEFIYYEDLWRDAQRTPRLDNLEPKSAEVFRLMTDAMLALRREDKDVLWGSMIKQTMKRKRPSFNEGYYGYASFSQLLEDAERKKLVRLKRDQGAGNYLVTWFAEVW